MLAIGNNDKISTNKIAEHSLEKQEFFNNQYSLSGNFTINLFTDSV
jgi:hypothetical protein